MNHNPGHLRLTNHDQFLGRRALTVRRKRRTLAPTRVVARPGYMYQHQSTTMNNGIMPAPDGVLKYRPLLLGLAAPTTLSAEEFDKVWPFVSVIYL